MIFQFAAVKAFLSLCWISSWCASSNNVLESSKEAGFSCAAQKCYELFFKPLHVNISFCFLCLLLFCLLALPATCACRHPCSGLWELLGDYLSLGAAELVWAQPGVAWQTVVTGVSLLGLTDWLGLTCCRVGSTIDRGISQLHRISCGYSHTSKGITLLWAKKIGFSQQRHCGRVAWWDHTNLEA